MDFKFLVGNNRLLAMWIRRFIRKLGLPGSNPTVHQNFSFCNFRLFHAPVSSIGQIQIKSSMTFIRGNGCIERERSF